MFDALVSFKIIFRHISIDLVEALNRFTNFTINPRFISSNITSASGISVGMPQITIFSTRSSEIAKVEKPIVFSRSVL